MCHDLGVSFGSECVPVILQFSSEFEEVFDYAIVHDCDCSCAVSVRVSVYFEGCAVGCPSSVSDAYAARHVIKVEDAVDIVDFPLVFLSEKHAVFDGGYADGVISSVFEAFKRFVNYWSCVAFC